MNQAQWVAHAIKTWNWTRSFARGQYNHAKAGRFGIELHDNTCGALMIGEPLSRFYGAKQGR